jgi:hypothetical protein
MKIAIVVAVVVVAVLAVVALTLLRKAGYRGAVGFKNRHASELAAIRLTGFSEPVDCRTPSTASLGTPVNEILAVFSAASLIKRHTI